MRSNHRLLIRRRLLRWYRRNKRDLPWRRTRDPYAIWISETMLQQTQVKTVIPYYENFLAAFPDVERLARAPRQKVLRRWSGLGYYRRADNLHRAARQILRQHRGVLPRDPGALKSLPGIGDYTAGALLSIAFDRPYPALDGNVRRVLGRLDPRKAERSLRRTAELLVPQRNPGEFNQALMELGAMICTPINQHCDDCPLESLCASARHPSIAAAASRKNRRPAVDVVWPLAIVRRGGKILLRRRAVRGLLAGLWEIPGGELNKKETVSAALARHLPMPLSPSARPKKLGVIRHAITHRRICAPVYLIDAAANREVLLPGPRWRWVACAKLPDQATSSMTAKAMRLLSSHEKTSG